MARACVLHSSRGGEREARSVGPIIAPSANNTLALWTQFIPSYPAAQLIPSHPTSSRRRTIHATLPPTLLLITCRTPSTCQTPLSGVIFCITFPLPLTVSPSRLKIPRLLLSPWTRWFPQSVSLPLGPDIVQTTHTIHTRVIPFSTVLGQGSRRPDLAWCRRGRSRG